MSAIKSGYDAVAELCAAGIVPDNCYHFAASVDDRGGLSIVTKCYATGEQWKKILAVIVEAKRLRHVEAGLALVTNCELCAALEMRTFEAPE